ncbi:N-acetylglucosamine kinase [Fimbriiglobus ruber]|nr:BadF/BadG/BcrA/BcrD ATPase family protein [Fimbriiglobus ruber]
MTSSFQDFPYRPDLVVGIDGGGTRTLALLARADTGEVLGRGSGGPSNIQSVGVDGALKALDEAIDSAFAAAGVSRARVAGATLGLAGVDRNEGLDIIFGWGDRIGLADHMSVANDATLLLAAGTPDGWGLAVIAGTGSIAFVRKPDGELGRCGGWGHTLGDEGSAYQIAVRGLRASCRAADLCAPPTVLLERFLKRMGLHEAPDLIPAVYRGPWDRAAIAGTAPLVLEAAAEEDAVATDIVRSEAAELAETARAAVVNHGLPRTGIPVALAGGVLLGSETYRTYFLTALRNAGIEYGPVQLVPEPAAGAVVLARQLVR